ncbi:zinc finger BED domain-containing protein RICESLEEPER 2-like [Rutidosis leptorrhynchoides]|uniref:zinc finger BED domain-containing protein RICESLEEPER 2-like n=1 Tax=Rutidosis leptorrhynchoides TaxID=125765 RepID=UPI003A991399
MTTGQTLSPTRDVPAIPSDDSDGSSSDDTSEEDLKEDSDEDSEEEPVPLPSTLPKKRYRYDGTVIPGANNQEDVNVDNVVECESNEGEKQTRRRATRKRSLVWPHYHSYVNDQGEQKSKCKYCDKEYSSNTKTHGTSTLRNHLKVCQKFLRQKVDGQTHLSVQRGDGDDTKLVAWKFDQNSIRRALTYMLILDELPFKFVEGKGFKHFMNATQPLFHIPSRITMARDCLNLFPVEKKKVAALLKGNVGRICLTTDTWTSLQRVNYMCLTAHYVDNEWVLRKKVLNFCPISSHRGVDIGKAVEMCMVKWGIESNVFTITVDNASANDVAVAYLKGKFANWEKSVLEGKWLHVRCTAHVINLIVQDGLSHIGKSVDCVRAAVKYIRQSPQRLRKFKEFAEIEKCNSTKSLILDVPTRWNSTYLMLETAQKYERAFRRYDIEERHYREDLEKTGVPMSSDWANVRRLAKFLEHFYELTLKVFGTLHVTANDFLDDITSIDATLNNCLYDNDKNLVAMAHLMKAKFKKYYGGLENCNMETIVASVLDPRNKFEYVEVLLGDVYGNTEMKVMCAMIKAALVELYEDYVRIHSPPDQSTMSDCYDRSSSSSNKLSKSAVMEPSTHLK